MFVDLEVYNRMVIPVFWDWVEGLIPTATFRKKLQLIKADFLELRARAAKERGLQ